MSEQENGLNRSLRDLMLIELSTKSLFAFCFWFMNMSAVYSAEKCFQRLKKLSDMS